MDSNTLQIKRRVLVVDDNPAIHEDFRKILGGNADGNAELLEAEGPLAGETATCGALPAVGPESSDP